MHAQKQTGCQAPQIILGHESSEHYSVKDILKRAVNLLASVNDEKRPMKWGIMILLTHIRRQRRDEATNRTSNRMQSLAGDLRTFELGSYKDASVMLVCHAREKQICYRLVDSLQCAFYQVCRALRPLLLLPVHVPSVLQSQPPIQLWENSPIPSYTLLSLQRRCSYLPLISVEEGS